MVNIISAALQPIFHLTMMRLNPTSSSSLRHLSGSMATLLLSFVSLTTSYAQFVPPCETFTPYSYDSGEILRNPTPPTPGTASSQQEVLIDTTTISHPFAPWIQLDLSSTTLAPNVQLHLEGISTGTTQILDAYGLYADNGYSAVFDGETVTMKLVYDPSYVSITSSPASSTPTTKRNSIWNALRGGASKSKPPKKPVPPPASMSSRVIISIIKVGICDKTGGTDGNVGDDDEIGVATICGSTDDRKQSNDARQGRMGGCTAWLISKNIFLRAGHCGEPNQSTRMHFTSSNSNAPIADQYAVDLSTYKYLNGGVGKDWAIGRLLPNSSTGLLAGVAQSAKCSASSGDATCGWYKLGNIGSVSGNIRITGYGTAPDGRTQKTHLGALKTVSSTTLTYSTDTEVRLGSLLHLRF